MVYQSGQPMDSVRLPTRTWVGENVSSVQLKTVVKRSRSVHIREPVAATGGCHPEQIAAEPQVNSRRLRRPQLNAHPPPPPTIIKRTHRRPNRANSAASADRSMHAPLPELQCAGKSRARSRARQYPPWSALTREAFWPSPPVPALPQVQPQSL